MVYLPLPIYGVPLRTKTYIDEKMLEKNITCKPKTAKYFEDDKNSTRFAKYKLANDIILNRRRAKKKNASRENKNVIREQENADELSCQCRDFKIRVKKKRTLAS